MAIQEKIDKEPQQEEEEGIYSGEDDDEEFYLRDEPEQSSSVPKNCWESPDYNFRKYKQNDDENWRHESSDHRRSRPSQLDFRRWKCGSEVLRKEFGQNLATANCDLKESIRKAMSYLKSSQQLISSRDAQIKLMNECMELESERCKALLEDCKDVLKEKLGTNFYALETSLVARNVPSFTIPPPIYRAPPHITAGMMMMMTQQQQHSTPFRFASRMHGGLSSRVAPFNDFSRNIMRASPFTNSGYLSEGNLTNSRFREHFQSYLTPPRRYSSGGGKVMTSHSTPYHNRSGGGGGSGSSSGGFPMMSSSSKVEK